MNIATIFAGGTGQRMKTAACPKQFLKLYGKPIIIYTLEVFQQHPAIDHIIVACVSGWEGRLQKMCADYGITKLYKIVPGGKDTQESKLNALYGLADLCQDNDIVLMHDAVRPMITAQLISDNIEAVKKYGSAITADPFTETGVVSTDGVTVESTIERSKLYIAKAPQSFYYKDVLWAHEQGKSMPESITIDTCTLMSTLGKTLHFVQCDFANIKITRPDDYYIFKALVDLRESKEILGL